MGKRGKGLLAACILAGLAAGWVAVGYRPRPTTSPPADDTDPRLTFPTPYRSVRPDVRYVGDAGCADCHPTQAETYRQHPMGRSLAPVAAAVPVERYTAAAHNPFEAVGARFFVDRQGERVSHREVRADAQGRVLAETTAEVRYAVGSGSHARSYLIDRDGTLSQSPITWYTQKQRWDLSPGFENLHDRFERVVRPECLFCHANGALPVEHGVNRYREPIFEGYSIGCERCHGPGELHVQRRERGDVVNGLDDTIVNPARLEPALRESVCQQCHLEGEQRVVRRGRGVFDFRPGLPLDRFWSVFVLPPEKADPKVVSSVEQMYASRCFQRSDGRLGCVSCHDPHALPAATERVAFYRDRCLTCHAERGCSLPPAARRAQEPQDNCAACHMPRLNSADVAHVAVTDHRIPRRGASDPGADRPPAGGAVTLVAFGGEQTDPRAGGVARDRGVALVETARGRAARARGLAEQALPLLEAALREAPDDVPAGEARAYALGLLGRVTDALAADEAVLRQAPARETALEDAATFAEALGRPDDALAYWRRALAVNPASSRYRFHVARLLAGRGDWPQALAEAEAVLRLSPGNVEARLLRIAAWVRTGRKDQARGEFDAVLALDPPEPEKLRRWFADLMR
jgi:Tetratricopeptide repeat/Doubled CXXCH motif (Paired_CXXCH_1)/Cytochrome c554 and c-prime